MSAKQGANYEAMWRHEIELKRKGRERLKAHYERELSEMKVALRPFAKLWDERNITDGDERWVTTYDNWADREIGAAVSVTWGELRAASRAMSGAVNTGDELRRRTLDEAVREGRTVD